MLSGKATNTNFIVFGLIRLGLEPTIYYLKTGAVRSMNSLIVFSATFNNISAISWQSVLLVEENGVPG
jgi:hypothetical protein